MLNFDSDANADVKCKQALNRSCWPPSWSDLNALAQGRSNHTVNRIAKSLSDRKINRFSSFNAARKWLLKRRWKRFHSSNERNVNAENWYLWLLWRHRPQKQHSSASGGGEGSMPPPSPVKISHKKDGRRIQPHRFHVFRPPPTRLLDPLLQHQATTGKLCYICFRQLGVIPTWTTSTLLKCILIYLST